MEDHEWGPRDGWAKQDPKAFDREPPKPKTVRKVIPLTPEQRAEKRGEIAPANIGVGSSGSAGANTVGGGGGGGRAGSSAGVPFQGPPTVVMSYRASPQTGIEIGWTISNHVEPDPAFRAFLDGLA